MSSTDRLTAAEEPDKPAFIFNIDGDQAARRIKTAWLQAEGYQVLEAGTGEDCLRLLAERQPDLVLLAASLPDADSAEVCRRIRANPDLAETPVVRISARSLDSGERARSLESGADAYLTMPADPRVLAATVRSLLRMHRAEEHARRSATRVAAILASITDAFMAVDRDWRLVGMNPAAEKAFGRSAADLLGKSLWDEFPKAVGGVFYQAMHEAAEKQRAVHSEGRSQVTERWYEVHAYPRDVGLDLYFRDISDRKRAEDALRDVALYYEHLIAFLPQVVWTCLADGRGEFVSPQWVAYTGAPAEAALGEGWLDFVHPQDREGVRARWRAVIENHTDYDAEYRFRGRDGQYRWFKARARPVRDQSGRIARWFGTCTDIEDLKRAQRQRDELLESERAARSEVERASRVKDEFVAAVSHELRTRRMATQHRAGAAG
jgi:PAS domain S-box-containing protein